MLYIALAGVYYEGSGVIGIFNSLSEAQSFVENDVKEMGENIYIDNYYNVKSWNTEIQKPTGGCDYLWETKEWTPWREFSLTA